MMLFYVASLFCGCQINTEEYFNLKCGGVKVIKDNNENTFSKLCLSIILK